ncbi:MAG: hypothetical protein Ta2B_25100 [Termitinemataceae bacterium]|nr:MAG: hypothetical protein Ta2B_25100 [Termitinemataceae bacterium]
MAKIALIKPNTQNQAAPHLGLGYLSSYAKKNGHDALIIDGQRDLLNSGQILEIIQKNDISIAGITCLSGYYNEVVTLSRYLKSNGIKIVIGGVHPTFMPYQTLLDSSADYVICGEGEVALSELLDNDFNNIPPPPPVFRRSAPYTKCKSYPGSVFVN